MEKNINPSFKKDNKDYNEYIDLSLIFLFFKRNKKILYLFSLIGLLTGLFFSFFLKKTWQGSFQIVLSNENNNKGSLSLENKLGLNSIPSLSSFRGGPNQLQTEVEILKSPSVLMNIFEYVKSEKSRDELKFDSWQKSLKILLVPKTSVLSLSYNDKNRELIIPVLSKISQKYQEYSNKDRKRSIKLGIDYLEEQIAKYKIKGNLSLKNLQDFAVTNDLFINQSDNDSENSPDKIQSKKIKDLNIELLRLKASKRISILDQYLKTINTYENDMEKTKYFISIIQDELLADENSKNLALDEFNLIEKNLIKLKRIYKPEDKIILSNKRNREFLLKELREQTIGQLLAEKAKSQAILNTTIRPKGVLIKFRELKSEAEKDQNVLNQLEKEYRLLALENVRKVDPWKLITEPTLLPYPVLPKKGPLTLLFIILGFISGSLFAYIKEKNKGGILTKKELENIFDWPLISSIIIDNDDSLESVITLLSYGFIGDLKGNLSLLVVGEIDQEDIKKFVNKLSPLLSNCNLKSTKSLQDALKADAIIIMASFANTTKKDLIEINRKLTIQNKPILGLLTLDKENDFT